MFSIASTGQYSAFGKHAFLNEPITYRNRNPMAQRRIISSPTTHSNTNARGSSEEEGEAIPDQEKYYEDFKDSFARLRFSRPASDDLSPSLTGIFGLESAKEVLYEATSFREQFPDFFRERRTWRSILLYGPPGAGKSHLSKAAAAESNSSFLSVAAGDLLTVSEEECENVVKEIFAVAKHGEKVVFCLDDVDILFSVDRAQESETLSRVKGQLLRELRILQGCSVDLIFIATSRAPWLLDEAFLCRMDRRVHIGLPDATSRTRILDEKLRDVAHILKAEDIRNLATECDTYSFSDMMALAMDVEMEPLRIVRDSTHFRSIWLEQSGRIRQLMAPCSKEEHGAIKMKHTDIERDMVYVPPVTCLDFELAMDRTKASVSLETLEKHADFTSRRGQQGF